MTPLRVLVTGANGRMGQMVQAEVAAGEGLVLAGAIDQGDPPDGVTGPIDVLIDFTVPDAAIGYVEWAAKRGVAVVTGTTGLSVPQRVHVGELAMQIPVVLAPNMSVGVNALIDLVERAARVLSEGYDAEILELHHHHKKDAPSGTALRLAEAVAAGRGVELADHARYERHGLTGARPASEIGLQTLRGGDVVGEHTVFLVGLGERLELTHRATDRGIFARGAVRAARWVAHKPAGLYSMKDVLG